MPVSRYPTVRCASSAVGRRFCWRGALVLAVLLAGVCPAAEADELTERRRAEIEAMSAGEKEQLRRRLEQFQRMPPEQQQKLRDLHASLEVDERADELELVMDRYCRWLKTLEPTQREQLLSLPPKERVERVKQLLEEQKHRFAGRRGGRDPHHPAWRHLQGESFRILKTLNREDGQGLLEWLEGFKPEYLAPPYREQWDQAAGDDADKVAALTRILFSWRPDDPDQPPPLTKEAIADLQPRLSASTREKLQSRDESDQIHEVAKWARLFAVYRVSGRRGGFGPMMPPVSDAQLADFFENEISQDQRDRLMALPADEMTRALRFLYFQTKVPRFPWKPPGPPSDPARDPGRGGPWSRGPQPPEGASRAGEPPPEKPPSGRSSGAQGPREEESR